ncbi:hypothetical protein PENTCL1PPCAC_11181 [Pristionchus entomophagus]|uniref:Aminotransferase class V domain-containing protein n=1 Tax=Pristionchus entomophagus TaxID=358040 RepID=A0AAV5T087_9BILA|nr:hypothetical protein PENTCL1PPCAC_11181 [Pristionchus entomophagus]
MDQRRFGEQVPMAPSGGEEKEGEGDRSSIDIMDWMRDNESGRDQEVETAFGRRRVIYADYAASAKAIVPIEEYLLKEVHPLYGNTHSSVTVTAEQTTLFVHEAREEIRSLTGAGDGDAVIFVGTGSTAAIDLLVHLGAFGKEGVPPLVVVHSISEHHTNILPWRETAVECIAVDEDEEGRVDQRKLEETLVKVKEKYFGHTILGAFTGASNVTGILNDFAGINEILKRHDGLSVWDLAASSPYVSVNVNGVNPVDALFFSGHKWPGAVATPGVLVVKKSLIRADQPKKKGGGTVFYVDEKSTTYLRDAEYREEGGTGDAIGIIRLVLAVKLRRSIEDEKVMRREETIVSRFLNGFSSSPHLSLLGPPTREKRLATFAFLVKDNISGLFFHHNYISVLLNDLFGIQSRAGCVCAGPYAQHLLGIEGELSARFLSLLRENSSLDRLHLRRVGEYSQQEMLRPGFTRVSIPYFESDHKVDFILSAIRFVATHAADFLHHYQLNAESGEWHHEKTRVFHDRKWLGFVSFGEGGLKIDKKSTKKSDLPRDLLRRAEEEREKAREAMKERSTVPDGRVALSEEAKTLRWFVLPIEIWERETKKVEVEYPQCVIIPKKYEEKTRENEEEKKEKESPPLCPLNPTATEAVCPLMDILETEQQGMDGGEDTVGSKEEEEEGREDIREEETPMEDWNKRVIVERKEMTRAEEASLPWVIPPLDLYKQTTETIHSLGLIKNGDKVLVCLSGGKDSLSLLHILRFYQIRNRDRRGIQFELGAITVDPGSAAYNPRPLIEYCRSLNIDYFYEEQDIIGQARKLKNLRSICAFCSRMKRGRLAAAAVTHGWNVLAMGQHLDDLAESFFIAAFQNGNLSTMKAQYTTRDTSLRVIRPLVLVREKALREFAASSKLPVVAENCPACFNQATERHRIKQMLAHQELLFPDLFCSLRSALRPLLLVDSASTAEMRRKAIENIVKAKKKDE